LTPFAIKNTNAQLLGLAGFVALSLLFIVIATQTDQQGRSTGSLLLATFASAGMFLHAAGSANDLITTRKTLENMRAPAGAWTPFLRSCLRGTSVTWLVLAVTLMLQFELRPAPKPAWLSAGALVSLAACLGTIYSLAQSELMPRVRNVVHPAVTFVVIIPLVLGGPAMLNTGFAAEPGAALALILLCWPALAAGLLLHWRGPPALPAPNRDEDHAMMLNWLARMRRYSLLKRGVSMVDDRKLDWHNLAASAVCVFFVDLMSSTSPGGALTANHLLGMTALVYHAYHMLAVRDLHWRAFVAPGGMRQRDIAMNIFTSTLRIAVPAVLLVFALLPALDLLLGFRSLDAAMQLIWRHAMILAELPLVIAAAVVLKGLPQPYAGWSAVAVWLAAYVWVGWADIRTTALAGIKADFSYLLVIAAATALLLLAARHLWTPRKILSYLKQR
jgi:hypothetical protein